MTMKSIRIFVLALFCAALCFLLLSCKSTDDSAPSSEIMPLDSRQATILYEVTALDEHSSRRSAESDAIWNKKEFIKLSKDTLEQINAILYRDYLVSEEAEIGEYKTFWVEAEHGERLSSNYTFVKGNPLFITAMDTTKIPLDDSLCEKLATIARRTIYGFECIYVDEGRVTYVFGAGTWKYIYTFDGKPPKYYSKKGDRNSLFPREESLGGNWYVVD